MEKLLVLQETADSLRVSCHTIRQWVYQGRIPHVRIGRRVFFRESDIASIIKNGLPEGKFNRRKNGGA
jgi:excisionase family DNA binding protein